MTFKYNIYSSELHKRLDNCFDTAMQRTGKDSSRAAAFGTRSGQLRASAEEPSTASTRRARIARKELLAAVERERRAAEHRDVRGRLRSDAAAVPQVDGNTSVHRGMGESRPVRKAAWHDLAPRRTLDRPYSTEGADSLQHRARHLAAAATSRAAAAPLANDAAAGSRASERSVARTTATAYSDVPSAHTTDPAASSSRDSGMDRSSWLALGSPAYEHAQIRTFLDGELRGTTMSSAHSMSQAAEAPIPVVGSPGEGSCLVATALRDMRTHETSQVRVRKRVTFAEKDNTRVADEGVTTAASDSDGSRSPTRQQWARLQHDLEQRSSSVVRGREEAALTFASAASNAAEEEAAAAAAMIAARVAEAEEMARRAYEVTTRRADEAAALAAEREAEAEAMARRARDVMEIDRHDSRAAEVARAQEAVEAAAERADAADAELADAKRALKHSAAEQDSHRERLLTLDRRIERVEGAIEDARARQVAAAAKPGASEGPYPGDPRFIVEEIRKLEHMRDDMLASRDALVRSERALHDQMHEARRKLERMSRNVFELRNARGTAEQEMRAVMTAAAQARTRTSPLARPTLPPSNPRLSRPRAQIKIRTAPSVERDTSDDDVAANRLSNCAVCMARGATSILAPCGHRCCCRDCAGALQRGGAGSPRCPICRALIESVVHRIFDVDDGHASPEAAAGAGPATTTTSGVTGEGAPPKSTRNASAQTEDASTTDSAM